MKYAPFILIILWIIFISVYDKEWPRTNISYHDIDTLTYNQFAFPELLEEEDKKIIERYEYLDYFIIVDEITKKVKLDTTIKEKTKRFSFLEDIYTEIEKRIDWENKHSLDSINKYINITTEQILNEYRKRKQYDVHEKKLLDINN
jgi:hypothetical protein